MNKPNYRMISEIRAKLKQVERLDLDIEELSKMHDVINTNKED